MRQTRAEARSSRGALGVVCGGGVAWRGGRGLSRLSCGSSVTLGAAERAVARSAGVGAAKKNHFGLARAARGVRSGCCCGGAGTAACVVLWQCHHPSACTHTSKGDRGASAAQQAFVAVRGKGQEGRSTLESGVLSGKRLVIALVPPPGRLSLMRVTAARWRWAQRRPPGVRESRTLREIAEYLRRLVRLHLRLES